MDLGLGENVIVVLPAFHGASAGVSFSLLSSDRDEAVDRISGYFLQPARHARNSSLRGAVSPETFPEAFSVKADAAKTDGAETVHGGGSAVVTPRYFPRLGLIIGAASDAGVQQMRADPDVAEVIPAIAPRSIDSIELLDEPAPARSWSIDFLKLPELWNKGLTGKGIQIGHLDSGVDGSHPALKGALATFAAINPSGAVTEGATPVDSHGHGTHTAGILCARPSRGVTVGVAPEATIHAADITGQNALLRLVAGLEWLLGKGVRLLSLSAGVEPFNPVFMTVMDRMRASGVLPIVAIGNDAAGTSFSPGNYRTAIGVGSITSQGAVANSSCSQSFSGPPPYRKPDLVAPGAGILSSRRTGGYEIRSGTSQAAPCVVGIAALLMQALPQAPVAEIEQRIVSTCRTLDGVPGDRQGRGLVDPVSAVAKS